MGVSVLQFTQCSAIIKILVSLCTVIWNNGMQNNIERKNDNIQHELKPVVKFGYLTNAVNT